MEIIDLYDPNYSPHVKLVKVLSLATHKCWRKKDSDKIDEDSSRFKGIADCAKESRQYKAMLAHFKLSEISNKKFMSSSLQNMEIIFLTTQNRYYEDEANFI